MSIEINFLDPDAPHPVLPDLYEVVNGQVVEPAPTGVLESVVASLLSQAIILHFANNGTLGRVVVQMLFQLNAAPILQRRPDLAFMSHERWPKDRAIPRLAAWPFAPDLAVEVVGPNDLAIDLMEKTNQYFQAGVRQVWLLYPRNRNATIYESTTSVTALDASGTLEGGKILPGFNLSLADLFLESA